MVRHEMYVDDLISEAESINEGKWTRNSDHREAAFLVPFGTSESVKALGLQWVPSEDVFSFRNTPVQPCDESKRTILSTIAKLFDPLGWISPCVLKAKIIMQELWRDGSDWDKPIAPDLKLEWITFRQELNSITKLKIPRWIHIHSSMKAVEIHGFSDASQRAYGAAIYIRVLDYEDNIHISLLMSKTKVAPLKTITLPRLELCGAVILATLMDHVTKTLKLTNVKRFAWIDSTITLAWIAAPPTKWTIFVCNRVAEIQRLSKGVIWKHIPTKVNPADLASRGILPSALVGNSLWWKGPDFLQQGWNFCCPHQPSVLETDMEQRTIRVHNVTIQENHINTLISKISNLSKLLKIISFCNRFIANLRKSPATRTKNLISPEEIQAAYLVAIRAAQAESFSTEIARLKAGEKTKGLNSLSPFLDKDGIMRVGGRLHNSDLTFDQKHPIILDPTGHFTKIIIQDAHDKTLHGGLPQMIAYLRNRFWILKIKNTVKHFIHQCVICFRYRAKNSIQQMGDLPAPRVTMSHPFTNTGVDYAGPMDVKAWKGRGAKQFKAYVAIFVCLATKAIHVELVSDMTTQAFKAAYRRFTARRGICSNLYSDNGTTFVGANRELQEAWQKAQMHFQEVAESLAMEGTKWHFIPPASPHFGGLWEAGVKSIKYHLKRVMGSELLTFEELSTLLTQIEACLNSRPLCPMSENINDFSILTPAHFLIGQPLNLIPQPDLSDKTFSYLDRWQRIQKLYQTFWHQWSTEYLARLQQRPKWLNVQNEPNVGDLVLLKDDRLPPAKWKLARIICKHPGTDKLTRVVTLKTPTGELKRPITKICPLPSTRSPSRNENIKLPTGN